jgi:hypothetical protein
VLTTDTASENALRHIRRSIGLIKAPASTVAACYLAWMRDVVAAERISFTCRSLSGSVTELVKELLPQQTPPTKSLFIPSRGHWTALFENSKFGADAGHIRVLAEKLATDSMRIVTTVELREPIGDLIWELNGPQSLRRVLYLSIDGRRREFETYGVPMNFEDQTRYNLRSILSRFDIDMLKRYLAEFEAFPFDDEWFLDQGAFLVEHHDGYLRTSPSSASLH